MVSIGSKESMGSKQNLVDLLMPLAERRLPALPLSDGMVAPAVLDPRFEALRKSTPHGMLWSLDTSQEAVVWGVVSCGMRITDLSYFGDGEWWCTLAVDSPWLEGVACSGASATEAIARCLVALVETQDKGEAK